MIPSRSAQQARHQATEQRLRVRGSRTEDAHVRLDGNPDDRVRGVPRRIRVDARHPGSAHHTDQACYDGKPAQRNNAEQRDLLSLGHLQRENPWDGYAHEDDVAHDVPDAIHIICGDDVAAVECAVLEFSPKGVDGAALKNGDREK